METIVQHPWRALLLTTLSSESVSMPLADEQPHWKYINEEMIKLGSFAQNQLNIAEIQTKAIALLAHESKDCRLFSHLLQTLQHEGVIANLLLALALLADYVDHFWSSAWPTNSVHKRRLTQQILKRFAQHATQFAHHASATEQAEAQHQFSRLQMRWRKNEPRLAQEINKLAMLYQPTVTQLDLLEDSLANTKKDLSTPFSTSAGYTLQPNTFEQQERHDHRNPKEESTAAWPQNTIPSLQPSPQQGSAWQDTLLTIAELLCEKHPQLPIGYLLRRTAIWSDIQNAPRTIHNQSTLYITPSAERMTVYFNALSSADLHAWQLLEQSLPDSPYWFDGHYLSARIAHKLGYPQVAQAIQRELQQFLERLPVLKELTFADGTPFFSATVANWLAESGEQKAVIQENSTSRQQEKIWRCYHEKGLEAALRAVEQQQQEQQEPRDRFYSQLLSARLLEQAGFNTLARQHYFNLLLAGKQLAVIDWEPSLFQTLQQKLPEPPEHTRG